MHNVWEYSPCLEGYVMHHHYKYQRLQYCLPKQSFLQLESYKTNKSTVYNAEDLAVATKETGLEVNVGKTKYMVMSRDQNAGRSHNIKIEYSSFERVEEFKYLGTTLTNQNSIQKE